MKNQINWDKVKTLAILTTLAVIIGVFVYCENNIVPGIDSYISNNIE